MTKNILYLISVLLISACGQMNQTQKAPISRINEFKHTEKMRDAARFRDSAGSDIDALKYFLKGRIDWNAKKLHAEATILFKLKTADTKVVLDSAVSKVHHVTYQGKELTFQENKTEHLLEIELNTLTSQETAGEIELKIQYETLAHSEKVDTGFEIVLPRKGDPVRSRVAFSFAEPESASSWMPCHNTPSDRALFASEFTIENDETFISNGDLVTDRYEPESKTHTVSYRTRYNLPTYLMAFSVGQFSVKTLYLNSLPVSVVYRKGLRMDADGVLKRLVQFINHFQNLTVPYPFEKYMAVMLPNFISGGIEHAGITFQEEERSSQALMSSDLGLTAHELAHQWFGDLVTIQTWDDLWVKEGMATLMAEEAMRFAEDQNQSGRLFGKNFSINANEAVMDKGLKPDDKYTSGPYDRAAWVYTQLRHHLGEKAFWGMWQKILTENAFGVINTEILLQNYVKQFAGDEFASRMRKAITAKTIPVMHVTPQGAGSELTIDDPEQTLLEPFYARVLAHPNAAQETKLVPGVSLKFKKGDFVLLNLYDIHPLSSLLSRKDKPDEAQNIWETLVPQSKEQINYLLSLPSDQMSNALNYGEEWNLKPEDFHTIYTQLKSEDSKYVAIKLACTLANKTTEDVSPWRKEISEAISQFPYLGMPRELNNGFSHCQNLIETSLYKPYWRTLASFPTHTGFSEASIMKFAHFPGSYNEVLRTFRPVAQRGFSARVKEIALMKLSQLFRDKTGQAPEKGEEAEWLSFFREMLRESDLSIVLQQSAEAVASAQDKEALPGLKRVIEADLSSKARQAALCGSYTILKSELPAWESYKASLSGELPGYLKSILENPEKCKED